MLKNTLLAIAFFWIGYAWAGPFDPIVSNAWVGESVPGQATATLQLTMTTVKAVKLLSVSSPAAESVEIHNLVMDKGAMKVKVLANLQLPEHQTTLFGTRGIFLMMTGIKQPLTIGEHIPVNLVVAFADKQTKTLSAMAEVRKMDLSYKNYGSKGIYDERR